jgi:GntR family transcriptional regulator
MQFNPLPPAVSATAVPVAAPPAALRASALPLFAQVRESLRERILAGALGPGDKLPSEGQLEAEFGVSRITVRQALADLHAGGLIEKVNGKGSFVTRPRPQVELGPMTGFYEAMRRRGHTAYGKVGAIRHPAAPAEVAGALGLTPGTPVSSIAVTRIVDGEPYAYHVAYASRQLIEALAAQDLATNDLVLVLQERLGYRFDTSQVEVEATAADARAAARLGLSRGAPVLRLRIVSQDFAGVPVIFSDFLARGDRYRYRVTLKR